MPKGIYVRSEKFLSDLSKRFSEMRKGKTLEQQNHKPKCPCSFCKSKRGEIKGKSHPNYGNVGIKNPQFGKKRIFSEQHKINLSIGKTGKHQPNQVEATKRFWDNHPERRKEVGLRFSDANKGKPKSEEHKKNMIKARTDWEFYEKYGTTRSKYPYPKDFTKMLKKQIADRDNHTCQICKNIENGHKFSVHHIDYDKDNIQQLNLILLCEHCHTKTNHHRNHWQPYFELYQNERYNGDEKLGLEARFPEIKMG